MIELARAFWGECGRLLRAVCSWGMALVGKDLNDDKWVEISRFFKYGVVGGTNIFVSYATILICVYLFNIHYLAANVLGFITSVFNSYILNSRYVFVKAEGEERVWWKALLKTYLSYAFTGLILSSGLMVIWIDMAHLPVIIAVALNVVVSIPINYLMNKRWAFRCN